MSTSDPRLMVHIRLPKQLIKQVDHVALDHELNRARAIEKLLLVGLEAYEIEGGELR